MSIHQSSVFNAEAVTLAGTDEWIIRGGHDKFSLLPQAFEGIHQIGVIGWSSQGPAQAQNLRDSLANTAITVKVGLRKGSASIPAAEAAGFRFDNGTLAEMDEVIKTSDLLILLISDAAQATIYNHVFSLMKKGATLGLSHGFLLGHLDAVGESFPDHINVVAVCPKGMGPSVRRSYVLGKDTNGAGINASVAIEQDINGRAVNHAIGWSIALGSPFTFETTMRSEYKSDIFGERGILMGAVHGIIETLYRYFLAEGASTDAAFKRSAECLTGPVTKTISKHGIKAVYEGFNGADKQAFERAYSASYHPAMEILLEIYDEVASGNEIRGVIMADKRHQRYPMTTIERSAMWQVGNTVRAARDPKVPRVVDPVSAGLFVATMMAQIDCLREKGHHWSEIVNESVIESVDSLNPYIDYKGITFMIDNCSTTARLGARKWAPRFDYLFTQHSIPDIQDNKEADTTLIHAFLNHPVHAAIATCSTLRPSIDIFFQP